MAKLKLAVLISGRGSNLQSLIDACQSADYPAEVALVVSNIPGAPGLARAEQVGIPTATINHAAFADRNAFESALTQALEQAQTELICLAGFMRLLTPSFVTHWNDRLINIHPSLLPSFKGLDVHQRAIDAGVRFSGCTVHFVRPDMDSGPIIAQAVVPIEGTDDAHSLAERILEQEHTIYPLAVRLISEDKIIIENERVTVTNGSSSGASLINPVTP